MEQKRARFMLDGLTMAAAAASLNLPAAAAHPDYRPSRIKGPAVAKRRAKDKMAAKSRRQQRGKK